MLPSVSLKPSRPSPDAKVSGFFENIRGAVVPTILLPESLTSVSSFHSRMTDDSSNKPGETGTAGAKKAAAAAAAGIERVVNDEMDKACPLPKSKKFGDFFTPSKTELRGN
jgi:hypothetical protein